MSRQLTFDSSLPRWMLLTRVAKFKEHTVSHKSSSLALTWTSISVFESSSAHKTITSVSGNTPSRSGELNWVCNYSYIWCAYLSFMDGWGQKWDIVTNSRCVENEALVLVLSSLLLEVDLLVILQAYFLNGQNATLKLAS